MHRRELFTGSKQEVLHTEKFRPLGPVSDYVVDVLPDRLDKIREESFTADDLDDEIGELLNGNGPTSTPYDLVWKSWEDPQSAEFKVARLDVQMLDNALRLAESPENPRPQTNSKLAMLVNVYAQLRGVTSDTPIFDVVYRPPLGMPPTLTYEDVVVNNPREDLRTMTGSVSESHFYLGHRLIEDEWGLAIEAMHGAMQSIMEENESGAMESLKTANHHFRMGIGYASRINSELDNDNFQIFRRYLGGARPGLNGASGQFTARLPIIDLLLSGDRLGDRYLSYLDTNFAYFPTDDRPGIENARLLASRGHTLRTLAQKHSSPEVTAQIDRLGALKDGFRERVHLGSVNKHLPDLIKGVVRGTGGTTVDFLYDRIEDTKGK